LILAPEKSGASMRETSVHPSRDDERATLKLSQTTSRVKFSTATYKVDIVVTQLLIIPACGCR
jgi:hypothetical protein